MEQNGRHSPYCTVQEALEFSATLRLKASTTPQMRHAHVQVRQTGGKSSPGGIVKDAGGWLTSVAVLVVVLHSLVISGGAGAVGAGGHRRRRHRAAARGHQPRPAQETHHRRRTLHLPTDTHRTCLALLLAAHDMPSRRRLTCSWCGGCVLLLHHHLGAVRQPVAALPGRGR